jgi:hypothetical protein
MMGKSLELIWERIEEFWCITEQKITAIVSGNLEETSKGKEDKEVTTCLAIIYSGKKY